MLVSGCLLVLRLVQHGLVRRLVLQLLLLPVCLLRPFRRCLILGWLLLLPSGRLRGGRCSLLTCGLLDGLLRLQWILLLRLLLLLIYRLLAVLLCLVLRLLLLLLLSAVGRGRLLRLLLRLLRPRVLLCRLLRLQ